MGLHVCIGQQLLYSRKKWTTWPVGEGPLTINKILLFRGEADK